MSPNYYNNYYVYYHIKLDLYNVPHLNFIHYDRIAILAIISTSPDNVTFGKLPKNVSFLLSLYEKNLRKTFYDNQITLLCKYYDCIFIYTHFFRQHRKIVVNITLNICFSCLLLFFSFRFVPHHGLR